MFIITRNGKTTVYKGWQAWLLMLVFILVAWILLALFIFAFLGLALTLTAFFLLLIPAAFLAAAFRTLFRGERS